MGIDIIVSPSLHELKDDLPEKIWSDIESLYNAGKSPMPRINKAIAEDELGCAGLLREYKRELDEFNSFDGHAITTHRRPTNMDVSKYDIVIIDEDIIYSTIIPSKDDILISLLKKLKSKSAASDPLAAKIRKIIKLVDKEEFFTLKEIDYRSVMKGHTTLPVKAWKTEYAKLTAEHRTVNQRHLALKNEVKEAEQVRKSVYTVLRQEQREQQPRRAQEVD